MDVFSRGAPTAFLVFTLFPKFIFTDTRRGDRNKGLIARSKLVQKSIKKMGFWIRRDRKRFFHCEKNRIEALKLHGDDMQKLFNLDGVNQQLGHSVFSSVCALPALHKYWGGVPLKVTSGVNNTDNYDSGNIN